MKVHFLTIFSILVLTLYSDTQPTIASDLNNNPSIYLSPLDVPIFYSGNPLEGLNAFAVLPLYSIKNREIKQKIDTIIEEELKKIGKIEKLNSNNMTGFGMGTLLNIQIEEIDDKQVLRMNLSIECPVVIESSNIKSNLRIWSINDFASLSTSENDKELRLARTLLQQFVENYQFNNSIQVSKPVFYIYN